MNQSNPTDEELFELSKDTDPSQKSTSIFTELESRLSIYQNVQCPSNVRKDILHVIDHKPSPSFLYRLLSAVAVLCLASATLLTLFTHEKPAEHSTSNTSPVPPTTTQSTLFNLKDTIGVDLPQRKYYAIYVSSSQCKSCIELLTALDKFYTEHKVKNIDFEIVYVELGKRIQKPTEELPLHFKKVKFADVKNKEFVKHYRESKGPSFVVLDDHGKVVAKHKKNVHLKSFATVLDQFSDLLTKI